MKTYLPLLILLALAVIVFYIGKHNGKRLSK